MICPICHKGHFIEPAPDLFQCAGCGNGDSGRGFHYTWCLSSLDSVNRTFVGITVTYHSSSDSYTLGSLCWDTDSSGTPIPHTVCTENIDSIEKSEYGDYAMPVVWLGKPGKLKNKMYKSTLGLKEKT